MWKTLAGRLLLEDLSMEDGWLGSLYKQYCQIDNCQHRTKGISKQVKRYYDEPAELNSTNSTRRKETTSHGSPEIVYLVMKRSECLVALFGK